MNPIHSRPIHFGTQIKFVPLEVLDENFPDDRRLLSKGTLEIEDRVELKPTGYAQGAQNCSIIAIHNKQETTVAHLIPDNLSWKKRKRIEKALKKDIAQLRKIKKPLYTWLLQVGETLKTPKQKKVKNFSGF